MADLRRHVPAVALAWDDEAPGELWRVLDGTLVFADVSGFTALTERLATRGRIGAEQIVETLNRVFAPMLEVASARGGQLLKFGGDALLFLFRGVDHLQQACDAAVEMRSELRAATRRPGPAGRLRLAMSVGIHSGDIDVFLVGEPTRELFVLGPAASGTARAEQAALAGEIALSPATAALLPASATTLRPDGGHLLRRRRPATAPVGRGDDPHVPPDRLATLFPHSLGAYLAGSVPDPEHRLACIAFARFRGTDAILADQGGHALAHHLHETVCAVQAAANAQGVTLLATDLDADGGKFFLGSGVPSAGGDHEGAMLRALTALVAGGTPLDLQIGVSRGHVFAAEVGARDRAAYSAMGDTTNTAARIMAKASPGRILAHPSVLEHSRTLFDVIPAGPFTLKGKSSPMPAYEVGAEIGIREEGLTSRLPFVGRRSEVAELAQRIRDARSGAGSVTVVTGPPGIGKSRLVQHALDHGEAVSVLRLRGEPYGSANAYRLFRDPLRAAVGIRRAPPEDMSAQMTHFLGRELPDLLPWAPLLADVLQVPAAATPSTTALDPQYRPDRVADTVLTVLETVLPGPSVIVVEDAHWADDASAGLLQRIATAAVAGRPWAFISVHRGDGSGFIAPNAAEVHLAPLPEEDTHRLVLSATQATPLRPDEVAAVVGRADGNPMFVEEAARILTEGGNLLDLPESVQGALSIQIDRLHPRARRTLRAAAVLGRSFRREVLERTLALAEQEQDPAALAELTDFLAADGPQRFVFRNSLLRDAAYEGLAFRSRTRLHASAGRAMEELSTDVDVDAPMLALHFSHAEDAHKTWRYARIAAAAARRAYANAEAAVQYQRALDAADHITVPRSEILAVLEALGQACELAGMFPQSVDAYRRAMRLAADDPAASVDLLAQRARVHERAGEYRTALLIVARARRALAGVDLGSRARLLARLDTLTALIRLGQEKPAQARVFAERAIAQARIADDPETLVQALMAIDFADQHVGRDVTGDFTRQALDICIEHGFRPRESVARANLGAYAFYAGRWQEALQWYESSKDVAKSAGNAYGAAECDLSLGDIYIGLGRVTEAEEVLTDAVRVLRASGLDFAAAYGQMQLARALCVQGHYGQADDLAASVAAEFAGLDHPFSSYEATLVRVEAAVLAGHPEKALDLLNTAEARVKADVTALTARTERLRSSALLDCGDVDHAAQSLELGLHAAGDQNLPSETALLLQVRARMRSELNDPEAAADDQREADRLLAALRTSSLPEEHVP